MKYLLLFLLFVSSVAFALPSKSHHFNLKGENNVARS